MRIARAVGSAHILVTWLLQMKFIWLLNVHLTHPALQAVNRQLQYAPVFFTDTNTMRFVFAQQDHMQVFKFVLSCLSVFQI